MKSTIRFMIALLVFIGVSHDIMTAQQATTRIEGKVTDPKTNAPVGCTINIVGPSGKKTKISSNAADGTYLAVLNEAGAHKFSMVGFNVYRAEFTVDIPPATRFQEIKRDFQVRGLVQGELIAQTRGFERNLATLTNSASVELTKLKDAMGKNQQMNVVITILPDEDQQALATFHALAQYRADSVAWQKAYKAWEKKYKKKKEKPEPPAAPVQPPPAADPNVMLVQQRKAAVAALLADVKNSDIRVSIATAPLPTSAVYNPLAAPTPTTTNTKSKKSKKPVSTSPQAPSIPPTTHNTMVISVGQVKRLFE